MNSDRIGNRGGPSRARDEASQVRLVGREDSRRPHCDLEEGKSRFIRPCRGSGAEISPIASAVVLAVEISFSLSLIVVNSGQECGQRRSRDCHSGSISRRTTQLNFLP